MSERPSGESRQLPGLYYLADDQPGFRLAGERVTLTPLWPVATAPGEGGTVRIAEVERRRRDVAYHDLPRAGPEEPKAWIPDPADEQAYEAFVDYVLRRATISDPGERCSAPFVSGLRDGLDLRATIRDWKDGSIHVREEQTGRLHFTNGIIDFSSTSDQARVLQGYRTGNRTGWVDPDFEHVGSASRHARADVLQEEPCWVQRSWREFSMITLDRPTWLREGDANSFYGRVIEPLLALKGKRDNLYEWLDVMFAFCARKPVVYYSRYVPSLRIHQVAWRHGVRLIHCPLRRIPRPLRERNRQFLFLNLTKPQWEVIRERVTEGKRAWIPR